MTGRIGWGIACASVLLSGCASPLFEGTIFEQPPRNDPTVARLATSAQQANVQVQQVSEQLGALNRSLEVMDGRLTRLETQANAASRTQDDIEALRHDIQALRAERDTLKREITDDLAARVEKIAARQQADARATTAVAPVSSKDAGSTGVRAASARGSGYEHTVARGQTLSEIARGYGTTVDKIMKANKISDASLIRVGQVLFIPD